MTKGLKASLLLHLCIILFLVLSFTIIKKQPNREIITEIDLVKVAQKTNLKPIKNSTSIIKTKGAIKKSTKSSNKKKSKQKKQKQAIKKKATHPLKEKVAPKPPTRNNKASEVDEFLEEVNSKQISRNLNKSKTDKKQQRSHNQEPYKESVPLSISQIQYIRNKITSNFSNPILHHFAPNELIIELELNLNIDGTINHVKVINSNKYRNEHNQIFNSISNQLIRACYKAAPFDKLPRELYIGDNGWKDMIITFDASNLMQ